MRVCVYGSTSIFSLKTECGTYIKNPVNGINSKSFFFLGSLAFLAVVIFLDQYFFYILHSSVITCICFTAYHNKFILSASPSCLRLMTLITHMLCKDYLEVMIWVELSLHTTLTKAIICCPRIITRTLEFPCFVFNCMFFFNNKCTKSFRF